MANPNLGGPNLGGGMFNGISPKQSKNNAYDSEQVNIRKILRSSWNGVYTANAINNRGRIITPFRAVKNLGDYLNRQNYMCGGPNASRPLNVPRSRGNMGGVMNHCDNSNIQASACNGRFVSDSSDYIRFKKERAFNVNYNDIKHG
jgi:hypothetical protein